MAKKVVQQRMIAVVVRGLEEAQPGADRLRSSAMPPDKKRAPAPATTPSSPSVAVGPRQARSAKKAADSPGPSPIDARPAGSQAAANSDIITIWVVNDQEIIKSVNVHRDFALQNLIEPFCRAVNRKEGGMWLLFKGTPIPLQATPRKLAMSNGEALRMTRLRGFHFYYFVAKLCLDLLMLVVMYLFCTAHWNVLLSPSGDLPDPELPVVRLAVWCKVQLLRLVM
ncbi:hypothetical protein GGTG_04946 [Gaeumannomyces tritici R3-111a-1]|uniref:Ubiquitin-like domain-containing protein n=1 Tax=Gaeumannomyces tritici (strain R3-111a-1) TaxID=644352 RepID=J3NUJ0_GAET3|nr:hypothetical protein GGTG_04946 [Gaeumannomyces tritici R3-111a-1]EJT79863.1 hypothetical protein GGTG_04946 [Gaeumannomyces tritici R3-111a-1]